jgi:hypothetical protein
MLTEFQKLKMLAKTSWGFWISLFLSLAEAGYTYQVFERTSNLPEPFNYIQAIVIALFMDMAVLYFTVTGNKKLSLFYWVAMTGYVILAHLPEGEIVHYIALGWKALTLPAAVYFFSHTMTMVTTKVTTKGEVKTMVVKASSNEDEVKEEQRQMIFKLKKEGKKGRAIADIVGLHYTTVYSILRNN